MDFTYKDDPAVFPIRMNDVGGLYGFCPAKALLDPEAQQLFKLLTVTAETGALYIEGGLSSQPFWFVELASWFIPIHDKIKFVTRAKMVLGESKKGSVNGNNQGRFTSQRQSGFPRRSKRH